MATVHSPARPSGTVNRKYVAEAAVLPPPVPRSRPKMSRAETCNGSDKMYGSVWVPVPPDPIMGTVQSNSSVSVSPLASVTVTVAVPEPIDVGVPETPRVVGFIQCDEQHGR